MLKILLITPPFTQLNTPYPATAYLKGFLDDQGLKVNQCDLSIELFNKIFTPDVIHSIFTEASGTQDLKFPSVWENRVQYTEKIKPVLDFLKNQNDIGAKKLLAPDFFPMGHRYPLRHTEESLKDTPLVDKAKHFATLFVEELGDFITANIDEFFSFTRYAEQISSSASSFDGINEYLQYEPTLIEEQLLELLQAKLEFFKPDFVCFTIPFPGNLFSALRCAQYIKHSLHPLPIAFGGGYCNTELKSLSDPRIFDYIDFITFDDGEGPLLKLAEFLAGKGSKRELERTMLKEKGKVVYLNKTPNTIHHHNNLPAPSYAGLPHDSYLSFLDVINPMHRLWTDGRWNKLTIAHGCYWKQCSFCDVTLSYIADYQPSSANILVDKIEKLISETGTRNFHFVDEAAPPKSLKSLAETLIQRKIKICWWTNIRFEKTFNLELCELLKKSGCIAVTGGLEVASDRLLKKMKKGVTIDQVAKVTHAFAKQNIMVHAYLMYGFPTETPQETIDSLEVVRQLFEWGCIQSAFWHQFTVTIHSPIGKAPHDYGIKIKGPKFKGFAQNDLQHSDPDGGVHRQYTKGLNLALKSFLEGGGHQTNLQEWFEFKIPPTTISPHLIQMSIQT